MGIALKHTNKVMLAHAPTQLGICSSALRLQVKKQHSTTSFIASDVKVALPRVNGYQLYRYTNY